MLELIHKRVGWKLADEDSRGEKRQRGREKGRDRQMERGRDRWKIEQKTQLYFTASLPPPSEAACAFPRGPALPAPLSPFSSLLSSALLLALLWLSACTTVVLSHTWDSQLWMRGL